MAKNRLAEYRAKRTFEQTPEPSGGEHDHEPAATGRFVVQEHHATRLHWDLRLEHDGVLASWAVPNGIPDDPKRNRKAVRTEDHPLEYLDFHGEIPKGSYGAGTMKIWDSGTYEAEKWRDDEIIATFHGGRLKGRYALIRTGKEDSKDWLLHRMDPPEDPDAEPMPQGGIVPMLAKPGKLPRDESGWAYEVKWDGIRAITYSEPGRLRLETRNLRDVTAAYPELRRLNRALSSHRAILDGEIVAFDEEGRPSFARMQQRMHLTSESVIRRRARDVPVVYAVFDVLWLDGHSLMDRPLTERRERLEALELNGPNWQTPAQLHGSGAELLAATAAQGLEGLIAKRLDSPYEPGRRSGAWVKIKNVKREEFVIVGWEPGEGRRAERIGALLVARHDEKTGELVYAGEVGTGFTEQTLEDLARRLALLRMDHCPLSRPPPKPPRTAVWVEPLLFAEIEFTDMTRDGMLRHPSFKGLREDKSAPVDIVAELPKDGREVEVDGRRIKVSNWSKVLWPKTGFTKGDLVAYYARVAPVLVPHLRERPLTLKRYPNGVEGQHFYEKQCPKHRPDWVATTEVRWSKPICFCLCNDTATLVWLANLADIELHTSLSLAEDIKRPTMMVFDLDPGPPADIVQCCEVALVLQGLFEGVGLQSVAKTSGSKGLQVYVPLNVDDAGYEQTKGFSRQVAEMLEAQMPDLVVSRMTRSLRPGKIFVDWSQNDEHKTTVNVYSVRAKERPTVSTPVSWDEVRACREAGDASMLTFDTEQVLGRVDEYGDLFAPALTAHQRLPSL